MKTDKIRELGIRLASYFENIIRPREDRHPLPPGNELTAEMMKILSANLVERKHQLTTLFLPAVQQFRPRVATWASLANAASLHLRVHEDIKATSSPTGNEAMVSEAKVLVESTKREAGNTSAAGDAEAQAPSLNSETTCERKIDRPMWPSNMVAPLLWGLLSSASLEDRIAFYTSLKAWEAFECVARDVLPELIIGSQELSILLGQIVKKFGNDGMIGLIIGPLQDSIRKNPLPARQIVDRWLEGNPTANNLDYLSIQILVEGVASRDTEEFTWRDRVIASLVMRNEKASWKLATVLACSAWPANTATNIRYSALIENVRRLPEELVDVALLTLARDARKHPSEAIATGLQLLGLVPNSASNQDRRIQNSCLLANLLSRAFTVNGNVMLVSQELRQSSLRILLDIPVGVATSELNSVLEALLGNYELEVEEFVRNWLERNYRTLISSDISFDDALPLLSHRISHNKKITWLLKFMCGSSDILRAVSVLMFERNRNHGIPTEALRELSSSQVKVVIHELIGGPLPAIALVPSLMIIGHLRSDVLELVTDLMCNEVVHLYPSTTERSLKIWKEVIDDEQVQTEIRLQINLSFNKLAHSLENRQITWARKQTVPELLGTCLCYGETEELRRRQFAEEMREYRRSGKMLWTQIASEVRIIYGNESISGPGEQRIAMQEHRSETIEMSIIPEIDPLGAALTRESHRKEASALLTTKVK